MRCSPLFLLVGGCAVTGCVLGGCATAATPTLDSARAPGAASSGAAVTAPEATAEPLTLAPGELVELTLSAEGRAGERLATPLGSEAFVLIVASTELSRGGEPAEYTLTLGSNGREGASERVTSCSVAPGRFTAAPATPEPPPTGAPPAVGATRSIVVPTAEGHATIDARAISVGEHAVIWSDVARTSLDAAFVAQFLDDFERVIMPRSRAVFGTEPDLDGDGRIHLVFSPLTRETGVAFFTACDLLPRHAACGAGNRGEYLYLTPPDAIAPPYNTPNAIKEILTHEVSHLLHFNRKVLKNSLESWDDGVYVAEGIGGFAQDVTGYQAGNLYVTKAGLDGIDRVSLADLLFAGDKLDKPFDGILRGVGYLFVRYLYDRAGGDVASGLAIEDRGGPTFVRRLLDSPKPVALALPEVTGAPTAELALDFYSALALAGRERDGGAAPANDCFAFRPVQIDPVTNKPRGVDVFARFHGSRMTGPRVTPAPEADGALARGGVELLGLAAAAGAGELAFELRVAPSAKPRVRLGRVR